MQRMKLFVAGVKVPKLGTIQDRVLRSYLLHEQQLEAKRMEFSMLQVLTMPKFNDANQQRKWSDHIKKAWVGFLELLFNFKLPEKTERDIEMIEFYQNEVKPLRPVMRKNKMGKLVVEGLDKLRGMVKK